MPSRSIFALLIRAMLASATASLLFLGQVWLTCPDVQDASRAKRISIHIQWVCMFFAVLSVKPWRMISPSAAFKSSEVATRVQVFQHEDSESQAARHVYYQNELSSGVATPVENKVCVVSLDTCWYFCIRLEARSDISRKCNFLDPLQQANFFPDQLFVRRISKELSEVQSTRLL